jgi:hypothetical protein
MLTSTQPPIENVAIKAYPVPEAKNTKLYLSSNGFLSTTPSDESSSLSYQADYEAKIDESDTEELSFTFTFSEPTWLVGYSKAVLHLSCDSSEEIDVFVQLRKLDASGNVLQNLNVPLDQLQPPKSTAAEVSNSCFLKYLGPNGALRASHAGTILPRGDEDLWPEYAHDFTTPIKLDTIIRLEVPIWPSGITFDKGESLMLKVSGHYMNLMEFEALNGKSRIENKGCHVLHYGGNFDSHLVVPLTKPLSG